MHTFLSKSSNIFAPQEAFGESLENNCRFTEGLGDGKDATSKLAQVDVRSSNIS